MSYRMKLIPLVLLTLLANQALSAQTPISTQDLISTTRVEGKHTCVACHGNTGHPPITDKYDEQSPILAAQDVDYLAAQLKHFKAGTRSTKEMANIAQSYSDGEIKRMAQYFSQQKRIDYADLDPSIDTLKHSKSEDIAWQAIGKQLYITCQGCHGANGKGNKLLNAPAINGQYARYVRMTLLAYKNGSRTTDKALGNLMGNVASQLSTDDIRHLAAYIQAMK